VALGGTGLGVTVDVGSGVRVRVAVEVGLGVAVAVAVGLAVGVAVSVGDGVSVGVAVGRPPTSNPTGALWLVVPPGETATTDSIWNPCISPSGRSSVHVPSSPAAVEPIGAP
jgi:hypothetical protein